MQKKLYLNYLTYFGQIITLISFNFYKELTELAIAMTKSKIKRYNLYKFKVKLTSIQVRAEQNNSNVHAHFF